jgi:hypothetical protein
MSCMISGRLQELSRDCRDPWDLIDVYVGMPQPGTMVVDGIDAGYCCR